MEFHKGEGLSLSASGLEVDWIGQRKNRKMGQCIGGGGRKVPGGKTGHLEEKCQLQSNYNLLSPTQLQQRSSLQRRQIPPEDIYAELRRGDFCTLGKALVCKMLTRGDKVFLEHINLVI